MIVVDYNSTAISTILAQLKHFENEFDENLIRHMILNALLSYKKKFGNDYGEMVLCQDGGSSWRKEIFPYYKANRKKARESSDIDWEQLHSIMNKITAEIRDNMPYRFLCINRAEADDGIATLVSSYPGPHMIISNDKDFQQLQRYEGVHQWSPMKTSLYKCKDPEAYLKEQIIRGDLVDGIPGIRSDDDTIVTPGKRQKPITKNFLEQALKEIPEEYKDNYERNKRTIDLRYTPQEIQEEIIDTFNNYQKNNRQMIFKYFVSKRLKNLIGEIQNF